MLEIYKDQKQSHPFLLPGPVTELYQSKKGRFFTVRYLAENENLLLNDFYKSLSATTLWLRYFTGYPAFSDEMIDQEIKRLNQIRNAKGSVLLATINLDSKEEIIGIGEMISLETPLSTAELALTIRDDYQGEGIGRVVAHQLVQEAHQKGIATLQAETMVLNRATLLIWQNLGLPYSFHTRGQFTTMVALLKVQASRI